MKKILISLVAVVILTGCGASKEEQVLTCTMSTTQSGMTMNQKVEADFVGNEVVDMSMDIDVELDEFMAPYIETMKETLASQFKNYSDNGAKLEIDAEGSKIEIDIDFDLKNMTLEQKKNLDMIDVYGTKEATQKAFEKMGYTCK